jgi:predicted extracellular nuclease
VLSSGHRLPDPVAIGEAGRRPPDSRVDGDAHGDIEELGSAGFDACGDAIDFYESLEHMLVRVDDARAVGPTTDYGEIAVVGDDGRHATHLTSRGGVLVSVDDLNPERILIDDAIVPDAPSVDVGVRFLEPIVGVMNYSMGSFKVLNSAPLVVDEGSGVLREELDMGEPGPEELDVASFNVENLSATDPEARFADLADIVVHRLRSPDVLVLEEVQDDSGAADDGVVGAEETLALLAGSIEAAGGPRYRFADIPPEDGADGGQPGGNIRTAFMVASERGATFVLRGGATSRAANQVVLDGAQVHLLFSPGRVDPVNPAFFNSRKPLAAEVGFRGRTVFVIANHWSSKLADEPLYGRWQPPTLVSESKRTAQARVVGEFVGALLGAEPGALVLAVGDFNDFHFSAPLTTLERAGLINALWSLPANDRYSYVFEGNSQALDHVLLSLGVAQRGFRYDIVRVNAEFHDGVSDHDPSVIRLRLD